MNMKCFTIASGENTLVGMRHMGDGTKDAAVLIVHGYLSANRIGPYRMYMQIANLLNERGYDVYRVDFAGCGESTDKGKITLDGFYDNFKDTLEYVKKDFGKVIFIGHCLGADMVVYHNSIEDSVCVKKCIGISPTPITERNLLKMFTKEQLESAKTNHGFERKGLYVDESFLGGLSKFEVFEKALKKNDNLLIFIPENDAYVDVPELESACKKACVQTVVLPQADHHVLNIVAREKMFENILKFLEE